jgi:hypothetical protein
VAIAVAAVLASAVARLLLSALPEPFFTFSYSDLVAAVYTQPVLEGHWPYFAYPFYYQPFLGWCIALLSYVAPDRLFLVLMLSVVAAAAAGGVAALLVRQVGAARTLLFWSCAPQLLLFGGANVDTLPVLFLVAATAAVVARRAVTAGVAVGLGAAAKVFPIVALPPLALGLWRRSRRDAIYAVVAALVVLAVVDGPALFARYSLLSFGVGAYVSQPWNPDSIWLPVSLALGAIAGAQAAERIIVAGSFVGAVATYALLVLRPALRGADPARLCWIAVVVLLLWTRLYSVQYSIWLLPVFALFVPRAAPFALMTAGDILVYLAVFGTAAAGLQLGDAAAYPFVVAMIAGVAVRHAALAIVLIAARRPASAALAGRPTLAT